MRSAVSQARDNHHADARPGAMADSAAESTDPNVPSLLQEYERVRAATEALCRNLQVEDTVAQSMPDASPVKWHLAHTSWFFEQFALRAADLQTDRQRDPKKWVEIFNSYYQTIGPQFRRAQRGVLTRPTLAEVLEYRARIDADIAQLLAGDSRQLPAHELYEIIRLGLHHERQHQELILTDLLHLFSLNPLEPVYCPESSRGERKAGQVSSEYAVELRFITGRSGMVEIGNDGKSFAYDNERPRHQAILEPHALANRPVNNQEFREFILAGGYSDARLWLAEAWPLVQQEGWQRPLYWSEDLQSSFTLRGRQALDPLAPVSHISFFEASAFCQWAQARLPTEAEWETAAAPPVAVGGNFLESGLLLPKAPVSAQANAEPLMQLYGDVWEWTASPYINYPGFRPLPGPAGEYNGKFMSGQWVLRGGSCATPAEQIRFSYRNYFPPTARWQFSGIRLAMDI